MKRVEAASRCIIQYSHSAKLHSKNIFHITINFLARVYLAGNISLTIHIATGPFRFILSFLTRIICPQTEGIHIGGCFVGQSMDKTT